MSKIAIVYGTSTGATEGVASKIEKVLGNAETQVFDVARVTVDQLKPFDFLILGASTTGYGDLQDDWDSFLPKFKTLDFTGKKVALFGLGDSSSYSDTFANGMAVIYEAIKDNAEIVGAVSTEGYTYDDSEAVVDGNFVGLALDEDNEFDQTDARIAAWVKDLKQYI
ncbi:flavodoxin I [Dysgonomonas alginatilytica]|uniref:Flavodoxin n=1 Tax=Dysgonomonas alginatilytica TaxID=1605892 RepID=A0A2V3PSF7_9BACT|nr:flavodoxin [Dysgonomonas alginatilytica]PXV61886.1 flavodoxin I [Dysgonomonas alginatilytica]